MRPTTALLAAAGGILAVPGAYAQEMDEREIRTNWTISPISLLDDASPDQSGAITKTVSSGDFVAKQRLLPKRAAVLNEAVRDIKGKELAAAGSQLFSLDSGSGDVFCLARDPQLNPVGALLIGAAVQIVCLKDNNSDGVFDGLFKKKTEQYALPIMSGKHRKKLREIQGGSYSEIMPTELERGYFVGVEYKGKPLFESHRNFRIAFGDGNSTNGLTKWISTKDSEFPKTMKVLGGSFEILSLRKNGDLDVRVDESLPEQPFTVRVRFRLVGNNLVGEIE